MIALMMGHVASLLRAAPAPPSPALPRAAAAAHIWDTQEGKGDAAEGSVGADAAEAAAARTAGASADPAAAAAQAAICTSLLLGVPGVLFDRVFPLFVQHGQSGALLDALEPHILAGRLPALAPEVMQVRGSAEPLSLWWCLPCARCTLCNGCAPLSERKEPAGYAVAG